MFQTLLHFFHMKGEGLSVEDMKSGDYKVGLDFLFFSIYVLLPDLSLSLSDRAHASSGPGWGAQAE